MAWLDDLYDEAGNLISKAGDLAGQISYDNILGKNPESGSMEDIAQSLLNKNYDPESSLFNRVTEGGPPPSMGDISAALKKDPNVDYNTIPSTVPNPVNREGEPEPVPETFVPSEYTMNMPAKLEMQYGGPQKRRNPDRVGGPPVETYGRQRMQLNANTEEEERRKRIMIASLRNSNMVI
jgi:hypothetical protein